MLSQAKRNAIIAISMSTSDEPAPATSPVKHSNRLSAKQYSNPVHGRAAGQCVYNTGPHRVRMRRSGAASQVLTGSAFQSIGILRAEGLWLTMQAPNRLKRRQGK